MTVTDNTASWKVKKLSNFTDKAREIATQTQAEEGVDNTKVMTPKGVDYRLNKDRKVKTFSSFLDLGLPSVSTTLTESEIAVAMPKNSEIYLWIAKHNFPALNIYKIIGGEGYLQVIRMDYTACEFNYFSISGTRVRWFKGEFEQGSFRGWVEVLSSADIATQAQAEAGSDNTTVMTPLRTKQLGDENYLSLSGGKVTGSIQYATSTTSEFSTRAYSGANSTTHIAFYADEAKTVRTGIIGEFADLENSGDTERLDEYIYISKGTFNNGLCIYKDKVLFKYKKLATNGALSMPSSSYTTIAPSVTSGLFKYTAPVDGFITVQAVSTGSGGRLWLSCNNVTAMFGAYVSNGNIYGFIPVTKGATVSLETIVAEFVNIKLVYAQSEV